MQHSKPGKKTGQGAKSVMIRRRESSPPMRRVAAGVDSSAPVERRRQRVLVTAVCAGLVLACIAVYGQTLQFSFLSYDDDLYVTDTPQVQAGLTLKSVGWAFTTEKAMYFHPLTWMSHMLDCSLYGLHPWGHHLGNLLFHAAASVMLFLALRALTGRLWPSAAVAALSAVHPLHVESVAWISERKDVLCVFFWALAMGAYGLYARKGGLLRYVAVIAAFVLGVMSKPMMVTLPCALLLLDCWPLRRLDFAEPPGVTARKAARLVAEKMPLFLIAALSALSTVVMQLRGENIDVAGKVPLVTRCANALFVYALYLVKAVWPTDLAAFYPYPASRPLWQVAVAAVTLAAITVLCLAQARRRPWLAVGWFWYLGVFAPVIGILRVGDFSRADRYTHLPLIGLYIMAVWGLADLAGARHVSKRVLAALSCAALLALTVDAGIQTGYWRNDTVLFGHAIAIGQESSLAYLNMASAAAEGGQPDEAVRCLRKAVELDPQNVRALNDLGILAAQRQNYGEAETCLKKAAALNPKNAGTLQNLGMLALRQDRPEDARAYLNRALEIDPLNLKALNTLAAVAMRQGRTDEALACLQKAAEEAPGDPTVLNGLGMIAMGQQRFEDAESYFARALKIDPKGVPLLQNLGACLANRGKYEEAEAQFRKALEIDPNNPRSAGALGEILAKMGRMEEAGKYLQRAAEMQPPDMNMK